MYVDTDMAVNVPTAEGLTITDRVMSAVFVFEPVAEITSIRLLEFV